MNSFGRIFRIHLYGESHSEQIGIMVDGCPPGIPLTEKDFIADLMRRKSYHRGTTPRIEKDEVVITSGVYNSHTTGAPIHLYIKNKNQHSENYELQQYIPRPGHADYPAHIRYKGFNDVRGGGMFSGRLTAALVAAGVIAKKIINPIEIETRIVSIGGKSSEWDEVIEEALREKDSVGGIIECVVRKVPIGLGEPFFDSIEAIIAHAMFSIPGIKGIEFGDGFKVSSMRGSEYNDVILPDGTLATNHAGGVQGGLSNGNPIVFRVAVRPPASIGKAQQSIDLRSNQAVTIEIQGRHDTCFALRLPVVVEAMTAIVLADFWLISKIW